MVERYITDEHCRRTAGILDIEDYKTLVRAAEDIDDIHGVDEVHRQIAAGEDELIDYREARMEWHPPLPLTGTMGRDELPHSSLAPGREADRENPATRPDSRGHGYPAT